MKALKIILTVAISSTSLASWANNSVSIDQLLSRKGLSCDVENTHLMHLSMKSVKNWNGFSYQFSKGRQTLTTGGVQYQGIQAAEVLKSNNGRQLALGINRERFGLNIQRVAVNITEKPYESFGYYWVAEGSPEQNRHALKELFGKDRNWQDYVSTTANGNTRITCILAG